MSKANKNNLEIECPYCFEENSIKLSETIKCKKCSKSLINEKYKKPILSAFATILIGSGLGVTADGYLNINRASVKTEYKMMKSCINYHRDYYGTYSDVRDNCACAVESMVGILDAQKARFYSENKLYHILNERYKSCDD